MNYDECLRSVFDPCTSHMLGYINLVKKKDAFKKESKKEFKFHSSAVQFKQSLLLSYKCWEQSSNTKEAAFFFLD